MVELYAVRHGESVYNLSKTLQGRLDIPLSDRGRREALALGEEMRRRGLSFDAFLSSPLSRALETCAILRDAIGEREKPIRVLEEFTERAFGTWEGKRFTSLSSLMSTPGFEDVEGYENDELLLERVRRGMRLIGREYAGKRVLLSTHSNALKAILCSLEPTAYSFRTKTANLDVAWLSIDEEGRGVVRSANLFDNRKEDATV